MLPTIRQFYCANKEHGWGWREAIEGLASDEFDLCQEPGRGTFWSVHEVVPCQDAVFPERGKPLENVVCRRVRLGVE